MSFWRSNGSKILGSCVASLFLVAIFVSAVARPQEETGQEDHAEATINIKVTLVGVTSYNDYLEIKTGLLKSEGVDKVSLDAEAPGLVSLTVKYAGEPASLIEKLKAFFSEKYSMKEKRTGSGGTEISISAR